MGKRRTGANVGDGEGSTVWVGEVAEQGSDDTAEVRDEKEGRGGLAKEKSQLEASTSGRPSLPWGGLGDVEVKWRLLQDGRRIASPFEAAGHGTVITINIPLPNDP